MLHIVNATDDDRIGVDRWTATVTLEDGGDRFLEVGGERRDQLGLLLFDVVGDYDRALERRREVLLGIGDAMEMADDDWFDHSCETLARMRVIPSL
jgi:hypothetical protein